MGAWGYKYYEDDDAFDFMDEIEASENPKELIEDALDTALESDYIDTTEGNAVIVSATYIDSQTNGTKFSESETGDILDVDSFPDRNPNIDLSDLKEKAVIALEKILGEDSELKELWQENEEDYPFWRKGIEKLIERLNK
ncbi:DUF4259 domain-containing protein [Emticicia sp. ODNR4P]|nr:DUF4259 domain-containing protein [Emticicia sp. ODNR4P]